jgi:hypothetical protein
MMYTGLAQALAAIGLPPARVVDPPKVRVEQVSF